MHNAHIHRGEDWCNNAKGTCISLFRLYEMQEKFSSIHVTFYVKQTKNSNRTIPGFFYSRIREKKGKFDSIIRGFLHSRYSFVKRVIFLLNQIEKLCS